MTHKVLFIQYSFFLEDTGYPLSGYNSNLKGKRF
jgi:hypothetical protein